MLKGPSLSCLCLIKDMTQDCRQGTRLQSVHNYFCVLSRPNGDVHFACEVGSQSFRPLSQ